MAAGVAADYVYFILSRYFLEISGGGRLFIDIALALTGRLKGGPARRLSLETAMMGSINGGCRDVVSTGVFTIPMMKRSGFKPGSRLASRRWHPPVDSDGLYDRRSFRYGADARDAV